MINYVLYYKTSGRVIGQGSCQEENLSALEDEETGVMEVDEIPQGEVKVVDGALVAVSPSELEAERFPLEQKLALRKVTVKVDQFRQRVATSAAFQDQAYLDKRTEATAYLSDTTQSLSLFPMLEKISVLRNMTPSDLANLWLVTNDAWKPVLHQSEIAREKAKLAVEAATTLADIETAIATLESDLAQVGAS